MNKVKSQWRKHYSLGYITNFGDEGWNIKRKISQEPLFRDNSDNYKLSKLHFIFLDDNHSEHCTKL